MRLFEFQRGLSRSCCRYLRSGDRNVAQDTALVVDHVAVAAADSLGLFDDPVEAFGAGVGGVLGERDQDGWPPGLDGVGQSGGFGQLGVDGGVVEVGQPPPDLRRLRRGEQHPEPFFYTPGGADLVGRIMIIEYPVEPGPLLRREVFGGGEQQPPVHPDGSATVPRRPSRSRVMRCRTSVTIWLASATRCHLSTAILASGRAARIPDAYGAEGSITTILIIFRNASDCSPSQ